MGAILMTAGRHAPTAQFEVLRMDMASGTIEGHAAPDRGLLPCGLRLEAGRETVSSAEATGFSDAAARSGLRLGWCGFVIGGLAQAVAMDDDVTLKCAGSGAVLSKWSAASLTAMLLPAARRPLTVEGLIARSIAAGGCSDVRQVLPFAIGLARTRGREAFIKATYRYLLDRLPDAQAIDLPRGEEVDPGMVEACWQAVISSDEYTSVRRWGHAGPFQPSFPFPLAPLDEPDARSEPVDSVWTVAARRDAGSHLRLA